MFGLIKKQLLNHKQSVIKKKFPSAKIVLHSDMPTSSINKMVELAKIAEAVNSFEPEVSALSDEQLKAKTQGFREHILEKSKEYIAKIHLSKKSLLN